MGYLNGKKILQVVKTQFVPATYQEKTISPSNFQKEVVADSSYAALSKVKINGILIDPHIPIESVQDNTTKYQKVIPNNVLTYGGLAKLGGLTKKYNQLVKPSDIQPTLTVDGITITNNGDGTITINGTATNDILQNITYPNTAPLNHKIYIGKYNEFYIYNGYPQDIISDGIFANNHGQGFSLYIHISNGTTINSKTIPLISVDLTAIYGTGNEPTTVDQFLNDYPKFRNYVPYTTGAMDYAYTKKVDITGFNIWDGQWELGAISSIDGDNISENTTIRSVNYIRVIPNANIYYKSPYYCNIRLYDLNKNYLGYDVWSKDSVITIPSNVFYFRFILPVEYGTTYNNDICINVSNNTLNGTYKPSYHNALLEAKIVAIKQKLVGLGYSADVLGYGLNNVYNYIDLENKQVVLNMNDVDLGSLDWNGDETANFFSDQILPNTGIAYQSICVRYNYCLGVYLKESMLNKTIGFNYDGRIYLRDDDYTSGTDLKSSLSGVPLIYELATPVTIDVSDILDNDDVIGLLESGGTITFENDEKYNLPSDVNYLVEVE